MNNERIQIYKRKLIELEEKVNKLNNHKSILLYIYNEIEVNANSKLQNVFHDIDLKEEISYLNDWVEFHTEYIEKYKLKVSNSELVIEKKERVLTKKDKNDIGFIGNFGSKLKHQNPIVKIAIPALVLLLLFTSLFILKPSITGHVVLGKEVTYNKSLNLKLNESGNYTLRLGKPGTMTSMRATGSIGGNGIVKIYIEKDGKKYLIYDKKNNNNS